MQKIGLVVTVVVAVLIALQIISFLWLIGLLFMSIAVAFLLCVMALMLSFTCCRIGAWSRQCRLLTAGEVVVYLPRRNGDDILHLSAMQEQAKLPVQEVKEIAASKEKLPVDKETVLELHGKGVSLRNIAQACGLKYHQVQRWTSEKD